MKVPSTDLLKVARRAAARSEGEDTRSGGRRAAPLDQTRAGFGNVGLREQRAVQHLD